MEVSPPSAHAAGILLSLLIFQFVTDEASSSHRPEEQSCYQCTYHHARGGIDRCRHPQYNDTDWSTPCRGRCFIRKDPNGFIYRGCASSSIFPRIRLYGQDCTYQGHPHALWWFCDGDFCNNIDILQTCQAWNQVQRRYPHVCEGVCRDKTGLYADPFSRRHYVACGFEVINGRPCPCCRPYYLPCPHRTEWNDKSKKCSWIAPPSIMGQGYKYGFR